MRTRLNPLWTAFQEVVTSVAFYQPYQFPVSTYGALGNGKVIANDVNITTGTNALSTTTSAPFTAGDVGKAIVVNYAGASAIIPLSTTISGFTDSKHVTLTANAGHTVSLGDAMYGSDDTAAIQAAINAAVAYGQANSQYAEVVFGQGIYVLSSPTTKQASPTFGNAQLTLPVVATSVQKLTIVLSGAAIDSSPYAYWVQTVPQAPSGTILFSTLMGQSFDATFGTPCIVGGPNPTQGFGSGTIVFSNALAVVSQITLMAPFNPTLSGFDFRGYAEANIPSAAVMAFATPAEMTANLPSSTVAIGLYMPNVGNNDNCNVGTYSCEGFYYGISIQEHFVATRLGLIYVNAGILVTAITGLHHGASILYASIEQCVNPILVASTGAGAYPLNIVNLETEVVSGVYCVDSNSALSGEIHWGHLVGETITVTGAKNVQILDETQPLGFVAAPTVPATTVAITNPFWRNAAVTILGGTVTVITIDGSAIGGGVATGVATTVIVPSGKTIAMTYSVAPTWKWVLM